MARSRFPPAGLTLHLARWLNILQWARENDCRWDRETCSAAAFHGDVEVLKSREQSYLWDATTCAIYNPEVLNWARMDVLGTR